MEKEFIVLSNIELETIKKEIKQNIESSYQNIYHFLKEHELLLNETRKLLNNVDKEEEKSLSDIDNLEDIYNNSKLITAFLSGFFLSTIINFFFL